jgi:predicted RNase H-like nuclease (RuvC/YqgF family)
MMAMTEVHKEETDTFVSKEEIMISLVPHIDELKGNLEELRSNENRLEDNVGMLKGDWDDLAGLKKELRRIKYEIKTLKKRPPERMRCASRAERAGESPRRGWLAQGAAAGDTGTVEYRRGSGQSRPMICEMREV